MNLRHKMAAGFALAMAMVHGARATTVINIDHTVGATVAPAVFRLSGTHHWTRNNQYLLRGVILVGNGATLNIEAGTVIRGANEALVHAAYGVNFRPGTLVVERGGKIYANGTAERPIIMTDQWDNHNPWNGQTGTNVTRTWWYRDGAGTLFTRSNEAYNYGALGNHHGAWGGLVLCGRAFVSWDGFNRTGLGTATIGVEGLDAALGIVGGGNDDDDSSGALTYVQIRYGGYQLATAREINGLTMYGVGRGTVIHHIEVFNGQDDMFEWFGGSNNAKYLVAWGTGDDMFDADAGYRGKNQFLFGVGRDLGGSRIESGATDKGFELDGFERENAGGAMLFSASLWNNATIVGNQYSDATDRNVAISMRDNAAPQIFNSIFMDFGSRATFIENRTDNVADNIVLNVARRFQTDNAITNFPQWTATRAGGGTVGPAYFYQAQVPGRQACIRGSVFWNIPDGLFPTQAGGAALRAAGYTWVNSPAGAGPWASGTLTLYSDWTLPSEGNITDLFTSATAPADNGWANATNLMPIRRRVRTQATRTATTSFDVTMIDPRAANDAVTGAMYVPCSWMTPTAYRGAFGPEKNWAQGWTTIASLGVFGAWEPQPAPDAAAPGGTFNGMSSVAGAFTASAGAPVTGMSVASVLSFNGQAGKVYQLQSATSLAAPVVWSPVRTFRVDVAGVKSIVDILGAMPEPAMFYRIVEGSAQ